MDQTVLYAQMMEWVFNTLLPILGIMSPVAIYLHMSHKNAMKDKVSVDLFKATIEPIEKDVEEIKQTSIILKGEIMDELKYIRGRVDQMADKSKK